MSFDALTIGGLLVAIVSGGFLVGVVRNNDRRAGRDAAERSDAVAAPTRHQG
jgi:hypothetical protein